jgi:hypothetical protein
VGRYATRCSHHATSKLVIEDVLLDDNDVYAPIFKCSTCGNVVMSDIVDHGASYFVRGSMSYEEHLMWVIGEKTTKRKKV